MTVYINGTTGYSGPVGTIGDLTTTGNTTLGDASSDTLTLNGNTASIPNNLNFTGGNLGLGVTPSAWNASIKVLEMPDSGFFAFANTNGNISTNTFFDTGYKYKASAAAARYSQSSGQHIWYNAASGTAGNAITFTQAMTLSASGNLGVGTTNPGGRLDIVGTGSTLSGTANFVGRIVQDTSTYRGVAFGYDSSGQIGIIYPESAGAGSNLAFWTYSGSSWAERARIDSSGNMAIGNSSVARGRLYINSGSSQNCLAIQSNTPGVYLEFADSATPTWTNSPKIGAFTNDMVFSTTGSERARIDSAGRFAVGTSNITGGGFNPTIAAKSFTDSIAGGIVVEGSGADSTLSMGYDGTSMFLSSSYRTTAGYKPIAIYTSGVERARFTTAGDFLVNATSNGYSASILISANSAVRNAVVCQDTGTSYGAGYYYQWFVNSAGGSAGSISHTAATTIAFQTSSDQRLKTNIVDAPSALEKISQAKVRSFDWKEDGVHVDYGFIAQELYEVIPEVVGKGDDFETVEDPKGTWQVEYGRLTPILLKAIQELKAEFDAYKQTHP